MLAFTSLHDNITVSILIEPFSPNILPDQVPLNRDFKIWYGETVVRRQIVEIISGDVMSRAPLRLSRRSLAFYYGKVPSFTYTSLREYKPAVYFSFSRFFHCLNSLV